MNELQTVEFELLKCFIDVCEKLDLNYFLARGSVIGALKYKGFIPWDDDIDVAMTRKDYEVFLKLAQELLPENIFLQNYRTDPNFPHNYSKLRNCDTTYIEKGVEHLKMNHGVFIDVFPIDGYPKTKVKQFFYKYRKKFLAWQYFCALNDEEEPLRVRIRNKFFKLLGFHKCIYKAIGKFDSLVSKYPLEDFSKQPENYFINGAIQTEFEGITVKIPKDYDAYLTYKYGNWRADLPKEQQVGHHYYTVCDLEKPYTEYIK